jgi:hypothetical protein
LEWTVSFLAQTYIAVFKRREEGEGLDEKPGSFYYVVVLRVKVANQRERKVAATDIGRQVSRSIVPLIEQYLYY